MLHRKAAVRQLKKAGAEFCRDILFNGPCELSIRGRCVIGKGFVCNSSINNCIDAGGCKIVVKPNAVLRIGDYSGISNVSLHCENQIEIGSYVNIGAGTIIFDTNFHSIKWQHREDRLVDIQNAQTAPVRIGNHVFIGARCIIGKGITIGEKSIVAAGSVVTKNIPPKEMWGGNPAKFIKPIED